MSTDTGVSHPPVSHPSNTAQTPAQAAPGPAVSTSVERSPRRSKSRFKMPPPQVIAAGVLLLAAAELLLWQVAGVWWGVIVHLALLGVGLVVLAGVAWWRGPHRRSRGRASSAGGGRPGLLGRIGRSGAGDGRASGLRGLLPRALGGRRGAGGTSGGSSPRRGALGRLLGGSRRSAPAASTSGGGLGRLFPGLGRSRSGSAPVPRGGRSTSGGGPGRGGLLGRLRNPFPGRSAGSGSGSSGRGGASGKKGGAKPNGKKKGGLWNRLKDDFKAGFQEGATTTPKDDRKETKEKQAKKDKTKDVDQAPAVKQNKVEGKPADAPTTTPEPTKNEGSNYVAVKPKPAPSPRRTAPASTLAGGNMSNPQLIRDMAEQLESALKQYEPEDMHQAVRDLPHLAEAIAAISRGFRGIAASSETGWPVGNPVTDALNSIANDIAAAGETAELARTARRENEVDIERGEAPRKGSISVERKWNV